MRPIYRFALTTASAVLLALGPAAADAAPLTLYGITGAGTSATSLYTVDPFTGATALVGSTGYIHGTGLDFDPTTGTLYMVADDAPGFGNKALYTVDKDTAASTFIGDTPNQIPDMTIGPDGVLRAWSEWDGSDSDNPIVINKSTGASTTTPSGLETAQTGVAYQDPTHMYVAVFGSIFSVDVTDGSFGFLFSTDSLSNMLENMPGGLLLGGRRTGGGTQFYSIDPFAQTSTALGFASGVEFSALAYEAQPVPEPGTILLTGNAMAYLWYRRRRNRRAA